jgi:hypothetical protein
MNCVAPLFIALMTILRSTGPVISTRRSTMPGAGGAPCHVGSHRMAAVSGRKSVGVRVVWCGGWATAAIAQAAAAAGGGGVQT